MKKYLLVFSVLVLFVLLVSSSFSCIYVTSPDRTTEPDTQNGGTTAPDEIALVNPPIINSFASSPGSIEAGETSTLSWSVSNATSVSIDQGIGSVALNGSRVVSPAASTVYSLIASNEGGSMTASAQVIVSSPAPPPAPGPGIPVINTFQLSPDTITEGNSATLNWSTSNATSVSIDQGIGNVAAAGNKTVSPDESTVYTIMASNSGWVVTQSIALTVNTSGGVFIPFIPGVLVAFKTDLIITDLWNDNGTIWYTIKNQGLIEAAATHTDLIIDGAVKATDYVGSLSAGAFRNEKFSGFAYTCGGLNDVVTVKADADSESNETDEANNSTAETWLCQLIIEPIFIFPGP